MSKSTQSFGEQAARFSLYAPLVAFLLGIFTRNRTLDPSVSIGIGCVNILLIAAGLVMGILALISMQRYGTERILVRAILGVIFNGLLVALALIFVLPFLFSGHVKNQVYGHWHMQQKPGGQQYDLTFNKDDTVQFDSSGGTNVSVDGRWDMDRASIISITIDHVAVGDPGAVGKKIMLGRVSTVDDHQLILGTDHGDEKYQRVP